MGIFDWFKKDKNIQNGNEDDIYSSYTKANENEDDIYSSYTKANSHFDADEFPLAVDNFNKVIDLLFDKDLPLEILSSTVFASGDELNVTFTLIDLYHLRGTAKFNMCDASSIDDFTESIKINKNYEDAYYMRATANFILLEDWQLALPDIKKYLTFSPDDTAGNNVLALLEEIKNNAPKISKLYKKGASEFNEAAVLSDNDKDEEAMNLLNKSKENLNKALDLYSQKNRLYMYQKSHAFSLCDIYFKKLQCDILIGGIFTQGGTINLDEDSDRLSKLDESERPMNQCAHIYNISKGKFKPDKAELGAHTYYSIV